MVMAGPAVKINPDTNSGYISWLTLYVLIHISVLHMNEHFVDHQEGTLDTFHLYTS